MEPHEYVANKSFTVDGGKGTSGDTVGEGLCVPYMEFILNP